MNRKIKAVVFDLGEVILDWRTPYKAFLISLGIDLDQALAINRDIIIKAELGKISTDEFCQQFMKKLGHESQWPKLRKIMPAAFIPRQETLALIKELQGKYRLALVTNLEVGQLEEMDKIWKLKQLFETIIVSSNLGIRKPDVRIFEFLLKQLVLAPQECLYIDDIEANIKAAQRLGFQTIHFTDPEESIKEMKKVLGLV